MAHFILLHGFNDRTAGAGNIDKAAPLLRRLGHTVDCDGTVDYGWFGIWKVRFSRHAVVVRIVEAIRAALAAGDEVVLVGYSNGCNFGQQALGLIFQGRLKVVWVHPALTTKFPVPGCVSRCWVCFTRSDWAVRMASWIRWLIPGWGRAGAVGYQGPDARVVNVDYSNVAKGHGGLWRNGALQTFVQDLHRISQEVVT